MGDTERPIPERLGDQHEQAQHLTRTGNGPTVPDEAELLAAVHGPADMAGFYTGPKVADQDDEPAEATTDEPAVEGDAPAADTVEGGESA
ncbi:hypothetical protein [Streptomyces sp. NBC_00582]|uniref:hypothetical protein n=1 Tax=Streptomyces sp. NBC_00582 TaxID=2975783 RepID=UPI002E8204C7|nr:hypothetical protein [Streptomyces sp. NBC_00582]WUB64600.1 hypothetical protein OG852_31475 [Streptomyces sp. NBC_00582]